MMKHPDRINVREKKSALHSAYSTRFAFSILHTGCLFVWVTRDSIQGLFLALHLGITPRDTWGWVPYMMLGLDPSLAMYKSRALPIVLPLWPHLSEN